MLSSRHCLEMGLSLTHELIIMNEDEYDMKMNLFGYTYKIYDIGYKTEMMSKECNAGDPLETPGGLYRGPPSNGLYNI